VLDRFKLAGVIATWWTDTLPDFKTLLENAFAGVIDGWIDAIADAVEDDEAAGPAFDPFGHKLVRRTMADYLEQVAEARADTARLKGEKEAFEQSNAPDDADEEELATWNYAKDLDRQMRELKADNRDALRELAKRERAAARARATAEEKRAAAEAKAALQPVFDLLAALEAALAPYEQIKADLAAARARFRELTDAFVDQLRACCGIMREDEKRALVLELFAQDVQAGLDAAVSERRQELVQFVEGLWDKYHITLTDLQTERATIEERLGKMVTVLGYS
jgi:type I restriction enzyme M protein